MPFHTQQEKDKNRFQFNTDIGNFAVGDENAALLSQDNVAPGSFGFNNFQTNDIGNLNAGGGNDGFGFDFKTLNLLGSGIGGLGNLAQGFAAIKQLGLAKDQLNFQKDITNRNFNAARTTINNRLRDQNAFKTAQGRTDLANLVI